MYVWYNYLHKEIHQNWRWHYVQAEIIWSVSTGQQTWHQGDLVKIFFYCENLDIVQKRTYFPPPPLHGCSTMVFFRIFYKRILSGGEDKKQESPSLFRPDSGKTARALKRIHLKNVGKYVMQFLQIHDAILTNKICNYQSFWKIFKTCFSIVKTRNICIRNSSNLKIHIKFVQSKDT